MSKATPKQAEVVAYDEPRFINTKWAAVAFYGWQNISSNLLEVLAMCLNLPFWNDGDHGVRVVHLRDGFKKDEGRMGECWLNGQGIGINLVNIFERACERTRTELPSTSAYTWYVMNVIVTMLHEAHHLSQLVLGEDFAEPRGEGSKEEEAAAEAFALESLINLAKTFKVEPAEWADEPLFKNMFNHESLLVDTGGEYAAFLEQQQHMLDNRLFFFRPESEGHTEIKIHTFKDYLHFFSGDKPGDESWMGEPIPVPPIAKAVAEINPADGPQVAAVGGATEAVAVMADQAANMGVITPSAEVVAAVDPVAIAMGYEPAPAVEVPSVNSDSAFYESCEDMEEELFGDMPETVLANTVMAATQGLEGQAAVDAARTAYQAVQGGYAGNTVQPAAGAPGTPFMMNGQPVGTNVQPDAPVVSAPEVNVYNPTSMDDNTLVAVIQGIYAKIYDHIFGYCGAYAGGFTHPSKVHELQIQLDEREAEAIVKMDCLDANGRWMANFPTKYEHEGQVKARILGATTKTTKMPYYKLYINANGRELCRFIIPQNPQKRSANGQFSKPALAAQSGSRILYIMEGNDQIVQAGGKKVLCKIVDGTMQV
jgi:hypothetical protein